MCGPSTTPPVSPMSALRHPLVHPFSGWDVPRLLQSRAATRPDHPFIVWVPFEGESQAWTFAAFRDRVRRLGAGLLARGIGPGDFVLIHLDNCPEIILAWYACAEIGAVAVTTNARSSSDELNYFAGHCGAVAAITQPSMAELVNRSAPDLKWLAVTAHDNGAAPAAGQAPDAASSFAALDGDPGTIPERPADPMAPVGVQYTSGTTSRPKGVLWTHANALWGARINALHQDLRADDVHLCTLPLFHTNAQAYSVLATLWAGGTCVVQPRWSTSRFWQVSLDHRCTWTSMVWFCLRALEGAEAPASHHYRLWGNGFCEPPSDERFGVKTIGWWGMTETMSHGIVGDVHHPNRSLAIGKPAPEYGVAILRPDGSPVAPGETGGLKVLGVPGLSLFKEYLHNPEATAASYDDQGWFDTGDQVTLHEDGFISFADRDKDMLKVGGENVAASEVERVIMELPEAAEVAVVAKKHEMLDEVPVAFVLVEGGLEGAAPDLAETVLAACREKLADFKVPREVHLVDSLPRSTLEKIAKAELRARLETEV